MHPRILIIATTPYSENYSSRSLDAYFHYWEKDSVAQIFSRNIVPTKGHCAELYQITDIDLLKRWLHKGKKVGTIYHYNDLADSGSNEILDTGTMQQLGIKHTPTIEILRRMLWKKKYWCNKELIEWLDKFQPECIFYNFSNHIFLQQIALYVAERYNIPIVTTIADDFYFNDQAVLSPVYHIYRKIFKYLTKKILCRENSSAVYISDKIRDKYEKEFCLHGETIYLTSTISRRPFRPINQNNPVIAYFGNIRLGRNNSLLDIATVLGNINPDYRLEVYSGESDPTYYQALENHPNVFYGGKIPYSKVQKRTAECDIVVVVEGFKPENINFTRYSLSTKAADSLACGAMILAYGPEDAGVISYLKGTEATMACTDPYILEDSIRKLIFDSSLQKCLYKKSAEISEKNHTLFRSKNTFVRIVDNAINKRLIKEK